MQEEHTTLVTYSARRECLSGFSMNSDMKLAIQAGKKEDDITLIFPSTSLYQ